ncbi:hypothetical protein [Palleronia sp.]
MPQTFFTPRHIIETVRAAELVPAPMRVDPALTRPDWLAVARHVAEGS